MRIVPIVLYAMSAAGVSAAVIDTTTAADIAAFQTGATVNSFENVAGRTPFNITDYTSGVAVPDSSYVHDEIPSVRFSVGGAPGTNSPALYQLGGAIAGDAHSTSTVLGPVDFDFTTKFNSNALLEIFFPTKVSRVGFWLNPALGDVLLIAADTNFAFSGQNETQLETATVHAGNFVGISRASADIGGFKVLALGQTGFTIDDLTFGPGTDTTPIPEPSTSLLFTAATLSLLFMMPRRR
jgi:hypothetical protein